jgi:hypothetical protein
MSLKRQKLNEYNFSVSFDFEINLAIILCFDSNSKRNAALYSGLGVCESKNNFKPFNFSVCMSKKTQHSYFVILSKKELFSMIKN